MVNFIFINMFKRNFLIIYNKYLLASLTLHIGHVKGNRNKNKKEA